MVTQLPQRTSFSGPALVRLLSRLTHVEVMEPRQSPAARLDEWLGWAESIVLSKVLNAAVPPMARSAAKGAMAAGPENSEGDGALSTQDAGGGSESGRMAGAGAASDVINIAELAAAEYTQLRTTLEQAIASAIAPPAPVPGMQRRLIRGASKPVGDVDFPSYRRRYSLLQQKMEDAIAKLRNRFRALLAAQSADLAQLAAVDAAMEQALAEHELRLLAGVPGMLEQRFEQLRDQAASTGVQAASAAEPGLWLDAFRQDMGRVMRAELNLRLLPVEGLLSAIQTDTPEQTSK